MRPLRLELKGFGAFREETVVDFSDVELAAFVGATGSGKSTIIDGITFALFGMVARYDGRSAVAPVINQMETETRVSLEFEVGGERYTAARVVRRNVDGSGATTREARLESEEAVLAGRVSEMEEQVERVLGLDFDRFTKTVVLPQGRFAAFLHDKPSDRQELLRQLLDLGIYERMGRRARDRASTVAGVLKELAPQLSAEVPNEDRIAELAAAADAARKASGELDDLLVRLDQSTQNVAAVRAEAEGLGVLLLAAEAVVVPGSVLELGGATARAATAVFEAREVMASAESKSADAVQAAVDGPNAEACRLLIDQHRKLTQLSRQVADLESDRGTAESAQQVAVERALRVFVVATAGKAEAQKNLGEAKKELQERFDALEKIRAVKRAEGLAAQLVVGELCPVCRQTVQELPDHDVDAALNQLQREHLESETRVREHEALLDEAVGLLAKAEAATAVHRDESRASDAPQSEAELPDGIQTEEVFEALRTTDDELKRLTVEHEAVSSQLEQLEEQMSDKPDESALTEDIALAEELAAAGLQAKTIESEAKAALEQAESVLEGLRQTELRARNEFAETRDSFAALAPPVPQESLLEDWQAFASWASDLAESLKPEIKRVNDRLREAQNEQSRRSDATREVCAPYFAPDDAPQRWPAQMATAVERAEGDHRTAVKQHRKMKELRSRVEELKAEQEVANFLGRLLKANGFERWLLVEAVGALTDRASELLRQLSGGRYSFDPDGMEFDVCDHHHADQVRKAKSLSGGETFLASLALALALRDRHAEMAPEGAPGLDSLFLDEGFGTLDSDTLDVTAAAIEELGSQGRMVAIITHIRELAERVPVRFEVAKSPKTSTVTKVSV